MDFIIVHSLLQILLPFFCSRSGCKGSTTSTGAGEHVSGHDGSDTGHIPDPITIHTVFNPTMNLSQLSLNLSVKVRYIEFQQFQLEVRQKNYVPTVQQTPNIKMA